MSPRVRRSALTIHVVTSVGWLGAVSAFLVLAIIGLATSDVSMARAMYIAMDAIGWWAILPLALGSLVSGVVQSLGTSWGLFRYYWIVVKIALTVPSIAVLLVHLQPISHIAEMAHHGSLMPGEFRGDRVQILVATGAALVVLISMTALSSIKPRGMTSFGRRQA